MPFKDTPDGQTHSYNDGCGEPAHNQTPEQVKREILEEFDRRFGSLPYIMPDGSREYSSKHVLQRDFIRTALDRMADITKNNTMREERQFILNVLNGIDSVDGPQATSAIRKMLDARYVGQIVL